ncbi:MAG: YggS family pyridoxal phosphate-dependent enzyme [Clostridia bacterium]|nr:YggS family pyridoxal phosphate-dependent enzyme [Clostridia bacterium]
MSLSYITENLSDVRREIAEAERRVDRKGKTLMLAAVKYGSLEELEALLAAGVTHVGENRVQQLLEHYPLLQAANAKIHFIGSLQTNKVKYIIDKVEMIHSVDSLRLAAEISKRAQQQGITMPILVEINAAREEAKSGVLPEEADPLCREILQLPGLHLGGFMTMGPIFPDREAYRRYFAGVREMANELWERLALPGRPLLSMGMSQSFGAAIEAGADLIRVGRRLFATRETVES